MFWQHMLVKFLFNTFSLQTPAPPCPCPYPFSPGHSCPYQVQEEVKEPVIKPSISQERRRQYSQTRGAKRVSEEDGNRIEKIEDFKKHVGSHVYNLNLEDEKIQQGNTRRHTCDQAMYRDKTNFDYKYGIKVHKQYSLQWIWSVVLWDSCQYNLNTFQKEPVERDWGWVYTCENKYRRMAIWASKIFLRLY